MGKRVLEMVVQQCEYVDRSTSVSSGILGVLMDGWDQAVLNFPIKLMILEFEFQCVSVL